MTTSFRLCFLLGSAAFGLAAALLPGTSAAGVGAFFAEKAGDHLKEKALERAKGALVPAAPAPVDFPAGGSFAPCAHLFPGGTPIDVRQVNQKWKPRALCAASFAVIYSGLTKTPLLVVERLSKAQLAEAQNEVRTEEFYADPRVPKGERAELDDYRGSGMDRGHLAPAANMPDAKAMAQSFVLSNMVPQDPTNNRKIWSKIESDTRKFARRADGYVYVFSGPLFRGQTQTIGPNQVWVPSDLFKLVFDEASGRSWAHLLANTATARVGQPVDYATFVQQTNWRPLVQGKAN